MQRDSKGTNLSAVFVDYDNIYLSLKRKSEEAAKRFSKDASLWIRAIENGSLITPTHDHITQGRRRVVMNRCYGNPVPKRNQSDNSTDMHSFPFVRHQFLRAGCEIVDCPPLTAQLKNSSDIRMVMDMRDCLTHETYFDEFVILSGDADFTPVLHRLRQHARRTVIFANDQTVMPYTALCDGEVRESDLIALLLGTDINQIVAQSQVQLSQGQLSMEVMTSAPHRVAQPAPVSAPQNFTDLRHQIIGEVVASVRGTPVPVPLETLADRAVRTFGNDKTAGTHWAGAGTFRDLLRQDLPTDIRVSDQAPFVAFDTRRHGQMSPAPAERAPSREADPTYAAQTPGPLPAPVTQSVTNELVRDSDMTYGRDVAAHTPKVPAHAAPSGRAGQFSSQPLVDEPASELASRAVHVSKRAVASPIQQTVMRIYEASQAPQIAPAEYRVLFEGMSRELGEFGLNGDTTLQNIITRVRDRGVDVQIGDVRFVMDVVGETDPWFEQGTSANLFAGRFRNFIVGRCREAGMKLSASELDLIDSWFAPGPAPASRAADRAADRTAASSATLPDYTPSPAFVPAAMTGPIVTTSHDYIQASPQLEASAQSMSTSRTAPSAPIRSSDPQSRASRWWALDAAKLESGTSAQTPPVVSNDEDDFPRIVRSRSRV
jgi:hypothetical protein